MTASQDFASRNLGKPYAPGAHGPDAFDCWGLVRAYYAEVLDIDLEEFAGVNLYNRGAIARAIENEKATNWTECEPTDGAVVAMSKSKRLHHVGVWLDIDGGLCLHAFDGANVVASTRAELSREFEIIVFCEYAQNLRNH